MDEIDLPTIIFGAASAILILAFTATGFVKGFTRMIVALIALSAGSLAAYWGFQRGHAIAGFIISEPDAWMSGAVGIILGLAVIFSARAIFGILIKPTKIKEGKKKNLAGLGAVLGIFCGGILVWFSFSAIRYVGTLSELQWVQASVAEEGKIQKVQKPNLVFLRDLLEGSIPGSFHKEYDPLNKPVCAEIAKLRIVTESPYAIKQVAVDNATRAALRQAEIRKFLENSQGLTIFVKEAKYSHLLESKDVLALSKIPEAREALVSMDITMALDIQPEIIEKEEKKEDKEPEKPVDPNAPKPGSARIF